jgi:hypothetical protein
MTQGFAKSWLIINVKKGFKIFIHKAILWIGKKTSLSNATHNMERDLY